MIENNYRPDEITRNNSTLILTFQVLITAAIRYFGKISQSQPTKHTSLITCQGIPKSVNIYVIE